MKHSVVEKLKTYALIFLVILTIVGCVKFYNDKQEEGSKYESFLNAFYFELSRINQVIDLTLTAEPEEGIDEKQRLSSLLYSIDNRLERIVLIIDLGNRWVDKDIYSNRFHLSVFNNREYLPGFAADGILDNDERLFLETLRSELESIRSGMYSEETKQENPNLTIEQLNKLITDVVWISNEELSN